MDVCGMCVSEGQLNPVGVSGAGRPGSPEQGSPITATGIPRAAGLRHRAQCQFEGESSLISTTIQTGLAHCLRPAATQPKSYCLASRSVDPRTSTSKGTGVPQQ